VPAGNFCTQKNRRNWGAYFSGRGYFFYASRLRPYREDIMAMKRRGTNRANMLRQLEQARGVKIGRTPFSASGSQLTNSVTKLRQRTQETGRYLQTPAIVRKIAT